MYRLVRRGLEFALSGLLLVVGSSALAAPPVPTLFAVSTVKPQVMMQGAQKSWPIKFSEATAMTAVFQGGMWLPNPEGGRIHAKYQRHILHPNGTWTWIGSVSTVHGDQSVVLTFGKDALFGDIPQASGPPLRISTVRGQTRIIATDTKALARSPAWLRAHSEPDYLIPPQSKHASGMQAAPANPQPAPASAADPVTIDLMVAYTSGLVEAYGGESTVLTRIQYLVDWANQAYVNSNVYQQLRLVHTVEVDYPDNNDSKTALNDLTNPATSTDLSATALLQIPSLRQQYGADLVVLLRPFDGASGAGGNGWLNGAGGTALNPAFGYSVVCDISDGTTNGINCLELDFAHELGHNMGNAHDRATSEGSGPGAIPGGGAYPYSYGYKNSTGEFATIMAYDDTGETYLQVFSNPNITFCRNLPCGVADSSPDSADDAHSMNNTAPIIAAFEPTTVASTSGSAVMMAKNDVTGDGRSALLWMNTGSSSFGYWAMDGATVVSAWTAAVPSGYHIVATGDFNGDGKADLVWTSAADDLYLWESDGTGFTASFIGTYPAGWEVVGAGDVDGDGKSDLLWFNPGTSTFGYWIMDGPNVVRTWATTVAPGWQIEAIGDFNADGRTDLVWGDPADPTSDLYLWLGNGTGFTSLDMGNFASAGTLIGAGNVDSSGFQYSNSAFANLLFFDSTSHTFTYYDLSVGNGKAYEYNSWSTSVAPGYSVVATGDFDGDGRTDLVWIGAAGDLYLWQSNGQSFKGTYLGTAPVGWNIIPSQLMAWSAQP